MARLSDFWWYDYSNPETQAWLHEQGLSFDKIIEWMESKDYLSIAELGWIKHRWIEKALELERLNAFMDRNCST